MLPKQYRLRRDQDIKKVLSRGKSVFDAVCGVKFVKNGLENSRFTVVVGLKVHKSAVKRNQIKRQYREIVQNHLAEIASGYDVVMLTSKKTLELDQKEKQARLLEVLRKAKLI